MGILRGNKWKLCATAWNLYAFGTLRNAASRALHGRALVRHFASEASGQSGVRLVISRY
jgi:hypothetical protein